MKNLILSIILLALFGCGNKPSIDYSQYSDELCVEGVDSSYMFSEASEIGNKTVYLNIHCTASREGKDFRGPFWLDFFKNNRGWSKPGYNEIVELNGNRFIAVPYDLDGYTTWDEVSYGVSGYNSISINIAYVGGVDANLKEKDTRTLAQKNAINRIVYEIKYAMPDVQVVGHRDHRGVRKSCPSFNVTREYGGLNDYINYTKEFDNYKDSLK